MHGNGAQSAPAATTMRLAQLGVGVLAFHLFNSILQEAVFHLPGFHHSIALSFLQTLCISGFALIEFVRANEVRKVPLKTYVMLSLFSTVSVILTNEASHLLNYPTQVIFKSSKLLFVMTLRFILLPHQQRGGGGGGSPSSSHHPRRGILEEIVSCLMIVGGLVLFTYATSAAKMANASAGELEVVLLGVLAIVAALCCDALLYIGEEKYCFKEHHASNTEVILFCYAFAALYSGSSLVVSGQLIDSATYITSHPLFLVYVTMFSLCNFCGTYFLLKVVAEFNSNSAVMITSVRKMFTVLCSFLIYPKPFGWTHLAGLALVSSGIYMHENARSNGKKAEDAAKLAGQESNAVV